VKKRLRLDGVFGFFIYTSAFAFPGVFFRDLGCAYSDMAFKALGMALIFLGQLIRISSRGYKAEQSHNGSRLLAGGPYQLVRNPMFLGILLVGSGMGLMYFRWWPIAVFIAGFAIRYIPVIFREEEKLKSSFGSSYAAYCVGTKRLIPSLSRMLKEDIAQYLPIKARWVRREAGAMATVFFVVFTWGLRKDFRTAGIKALFQELGFFSVALLILVGIITYLLRRTRNYDAAHKD
jgi:protein-S-isoprenylcysteine O-methyltransferase Ste14